MKYHITCPSCQNNNISLTHNIRGGFGTVYGICDDCGQSFKIYSFQFSLRGIKLSEAKK